MSQATEVVGLQECVRLLLNEAKEGIEERRAEKQEPYFHPVTLVFGQDNQRQFTCFSRDISGTGIGLLHFMAVEPGEVILTIPSDSCGNVRIRSEIIWCQPCGDGWYLSGARFIELISSTCKID